MKKRMVTILIMMLIAICFTDSFNYAATTETIDVTNLEKGIVDITYKASDTLKYKVLIAKGDQKITYPFDASGKSVAFPLQLGNGTYKIGLLKNVSGTKYVYVAQLSVELNLKDPNIVFLNAIQNINWNEDQKAIEFGKTLLKSNTTTSKRISTLYGYMVKNVSYDYDKIAKLTADYIPNVEQTYVDLKGICYDYSALFASIERSQGIPVKLVKGYSKFVNGYHAWNEAFIDGKWVIIDNTVDSTWKGSKTGLTMFKNEKDYTKVNEY